MLVTEIHYVNSPIQLTHSPGTEFSMCRWAAWRGQNVWWGAWPPAPPSGYGPEYCDPSLPCPCIRVSVCLSYRAYPLDQQRCISGLGLLQSTNRKSSHTDQCRYTYVIGFLRFSTCHLLRVAVQIFFSPKKR